MPAPRILSAAAVAVLAAALLSGCVSGTAVATKSNAILKAVSELPGVVASSTAFNEHTVASDPHSRIDLEVSPDATAAQVGTIITEFAHANVKTGLELVSSELKLAVTGAPDTLDLLWSPITDTQATTLATTWIELRGHYATTTLGMTIASGDDYKVDLQVALHDTSLNAELTAFHDAQQIYSTLGPVGRYENDSFAADNGLPDDAALTTLYNLNTVLTADGQDPKLVATLDGLQNLFFVVATVADSTDAATGLNAAAVRAITAVPSTAPAISIEFKSAGDASTIVKFDDSACDIYVGLPETDPARRLIELWAQDGRTLLDGSTVASCFA